MNARLIRKQALIWALLVAVFTIVGGELTAVFSNTAAAYGRMDVPGTKVLQLPSGTVDVAFREVGLTSNGGSIPIPKMDISAQPAGGSGPAPTLVKSYGSVITVNNESHERVRRMQVPSAGRYRVTVQGGAILGAQMWFGHGGSAHLVFGIGGLIVLLLIAAWVVARFKTPDPEPEYVPPPSRWRSRAPSGGTPRSEDDRVAQLERLAELHASGALSDSEFEAEKARIIGS